MSIGGLMRTSVSGMNAQATRLSAVSENIANANTNGYKKTTTEFTSQILASGKGQFNSGAVEANVRTLVSEQGGVSYTSNSANSKAVDLAIQGSGFLVVSDGAGGNFLTRAGAFTRMPNGSLVNAAGYTLMGYPVDASGKVDGYTLNGYGGLKTVDMTANLMAAAPSTSGTLTANLPKATAPVAAGTTIPSSAGIVANTTVAYTKRNSIEVFDNSGAAVKLDVYYTKTGANAWEMTVYRADQAATASTSTSAPFPYGTTIAGWPQTATLTFDPATSKLTTIAQTSPATTTVDTTTKNGVFNIDMSSTANNGKKIGLNISDMTSFTSDYVTTDAKVDGHPAEVVDKVSVGSDGLLTATFTSGKVRPLYKIPLAKVDAPDNLTGVSGNAYAAGVEAGSLLMGFGGSGGFGTVQAGALESSTVDLASELTSMIESQRSYTANSKVFQTGSEIMDVLVNLKR